MIRVVWNDRVVSSIVANAAADGLSDAAEFILEEANRKVPHDEGNLQRSGSPSVDPSKMEAVVSYDTPYAVRLHEHPEYNFQKGREGKWLENTMRDKRDEALVHIANKIRQATR
jgi:hypothetical protein